ncbi:MAG: hypothetical protein H7339_15845 [Arcicella sp.]|nr:hypothetical protein [Arcicella sp.]
MSLTNNIAAIYLDESLVPLIIGISKISDNLKKSLVSYETQVQDIEKLMNQKMPQIYCDKPNTPIPVEIGEYVSISLAISIFLSVFWMGLVVLKSSEKNIHIL